MELCPARLRGGTNPIQTYVPKRFPNTSPTKIVFSLPPPRLKWQKKGISMPHRLVFRPQFNEFLRTASGSTVLRTHPSFPPEPAPDIILFIVGSYVMWDTTSCGARFSRPRPKRPSPIVVCSNRAIGIRDHRSDQRNVVLG